MGETAPPPPSKQAAPPAPPPTADCPTEAGARGWRVHTALPDCSAEAHRRICASTASQTGGTATSSSTSGATEAGSGGRRIYPPVPDRTSAAHRRIRTSAAGSPAGCTDVLTDAAGSIEAGPRTRRVHPAFRNSPAAIAAQGRMATAAARSLAARGLQQHVPDAGTPPCPQETGREREQRVQPLFQTGSCTRTTGTFALSYASTATLIADEPGRRFCQSVWRRTERAGIGIVIPIPVEPAIDAAGPAAAPRSHRSILFDAPPPSGMGGPPPGVASPPPGQLPPGESEYTRMIKRPQGLGMEGPGAGPGAATPAAPGVGMGMPQMQMPGGVPRYRGRTCKVHRCRRRSSTHPAHPFRADICRGRRLTPRRRRFAVRRCKRLTCRRRRCRLWAR